MVSFVTIGLIFLCSSTPVIAPPTNRKVLPLVESASPTVLQDAVEVARLETENKVKFIEEARHSIISAFDNKDCYWLAPVLFLDFAKKNNGFISVSDLVPRLPAYFNGPINEEVFEPYLWFPQYDTGITEEDRKSVKRIRVLRFMKDPTNFYGGLAFRPTPEAQKDECLTMRCPKPVMKSIASVMRALNEYPEPVNQEGDPSPFAEVFRNWRFLFNMKDKVLSFTDGEAHLDIPLITYDVVMWGLICRLSLEEKLTPLMVRLDPLKPGSYRLSLTILNDPWVATLPNVYRKKKGSEDTLISAINMYIVAENRSATPGLPLPPKPQEEEAQQEKAEQEKRHICETTTKKSKRRHKKLHQSGALPSKSHDEDLHQSGTLPSKSHHEDLHQPGTLPSFATTVELEAK